MWGPRAEHPSKEALLSSRLRSLRGGNCWQLGSAPTPESRSSAVGFCGNSLHSQQRNETLGVSHLWKARKCGRPSNQGGGCGTGRSGGVKRDSPGWGAPLVGNPLELTVSVSVCTRLCQGIAVGVERRGAVIVYDFSSASNT